MPNPGDYIRDPRTGHGRLVDPARCGGCGAPFGGTSWRRSFEGCTCTSGSRGHQTWSHSCGWSLTVPPHEVGYRRQVY